MDDSRFLALAASCCGAEASAALTDVEIHLQITTGGSDLISRAEFAMIMNAVLHHDLLARVPTGAAYVADNRMAGRKIAFDHGALRTISFGGERPTGALPGGKKAFARILEPLGYAVTNVYPLDRLSMTGFAFAQQDFPEHIPQFFVSALHADRFPESFQTAALNVFQSSRDPLTDEARLALADFAQKGTTSLARAIAAMPSIIAAFGRQH